MDTKAPKNLDPKLKEVYERVMGTKVPSAPSNISTTQPINQPQAPIQQLKPDIPATPHAPSIPSIPSKQPIATPPTPPTPPSHPASQAFVAGNNNKKSKGPLTIALFIILGIIFFLVYMIFWIKLFGVHLSFLPF